MQEGTEPLGRIFRLFVSQNRYVCDAKDNCAKVAHLLMELSCLRRHKLSQGSLKSLTWCT